MVSNQLLVPNNNSIGRAIREEESLEHDLLDRNHEEADHCC